MFKNQNTNPLISYETQIRNGRNYEIPIFFNCITALKDYEDKSFEELRLEDYILNRKYPLRAPIINNNTQLSITTTATTTTTPAQPKPILTDGTKNIKYKPTLGCDFSKICKNTNNLIYIDTEFNHINAMLEYENMSQEELRYFDYINGLKFKTLKNVINKAKKEEKEEDSDEITSCPICLESLLDIKKSGRKLNVTLCGHVICKNCTENWIKNKAVNKSQLECPTCRKKIFKEQIHQLFI